MAYTGKEPLLTDRKQGNVCRPKLVSFLFVLALFGVVYGCFWCHSTRSYVRELENELDTYRKLIRNLTTRVSRERDYYNSKFRSMNVTITNGKQCCDRQEESERKVEECNAQRSEESLKCKDQITLSTINSRKVEQEYSAKLQLCSESMAKLEKQLQGHPKDNSSLWRKEQNALGSITSKPNFVPPLKGNEELREPSTNDNSMGSQVKPSNGTKTSGKKTEENPFIKHSSFDFDKSRKAALTPVPNSLITDKLWERDRILKITSFIPLKDMHNATRTQPKGVIQDKDIIQKKNSSIKASDEYGADDNYDDEYSLPLEKSANGTAPVGKASSTKVIDSDIAPSKEEHQKHQKGGKTGDDTQSPEEYEDDYN